MRKIIFASALFFACSTLRAQVDANQVQTATFEDGTTIKFSMVENAGDELYTNSLAVIGNLYASGGGTALYFSHIRPDKFFANAEVCPGMIGNEQEFHVGGMYFLAAKQKKYTLPFTLKSVVSGNTETHYVIKTDAYKGRHFGVHAEAGFKHHKFEPSLAYFGTSAEFTNYTFQSFSSGELAIGLGMAGTKNGIVHIDNSNSYAGGTRLFTATADILVFPGEKVEFSQVDSVGVEHPGQGSFDVKNFSNGKIGFRIMAQGQTTFAYRKKDKIPTTCLGFMWRLGVEKSNYVDSSTGILPGGEIAVLLGLGFFLTFGNN
jgi:hypothetical protein